MVHTGPKAGMVACPSDGIMDRGNGEWFKISWGFNEIVAVTAGWYFAKNPFVEGIDLLKIGRFLSARVKGRADDNLLVLPIQLRHKDRHLGAEGDVVETSTQALYLSAGALGSYAEREGLPLPKQLHRCLNVAMPPAPVYRIAAQPPEEPTVGLPEEAGFPKVLNVNTQGCAREYTDGEIPVRSMRQHNHDILGRQTIVLQFDAPTQKPEQSYTYSP